MSEPIAELLSRFTPDAGGLDRDALLFAAGRASARPSRRWIALAGALAASQLLTLVLLWPQPAVVNAPMIVDKAPPKVGPAPHKEPSPEPSPSPSSLLVLQQQFLEKGDLPAPQHFSGDMVPDAPPLRAFSISSDIFSN